MPNLESKHAAIVVLLAAITAGCGGAANTDAASDSAPIVVDSEQARYVGSFTLASKLGDNQMTMDLALPNGEPVVGARVAADARMLYHSHFSSQMPICVADGDGRYQLVNLVFDMPGSWNVKVSVEGDPGLDSFDLPFFVE